MKSRNGVFEKGQTFNEVFNEVFQIPRYFGMIWFSGDTERPYKVFFVA